MSIYPDDPKLDELIRELVAYTGENPTQALVIAVSERLVREKQHRQRSLAEELLRIGRECAALPVLDARAADEILGYDQNGIPG